MTDNIGGVFIVGMVFGAILGGAAGYVIGAIITKNRWMPIVEGYKQLWANRRK